jgi:dynein heavy chain, axonemal
VRLVVTGLKQNSISLRERMSFVLQMMVQATMQIYEKAMSEFLPTPTKSHYVFNLRDFARVMRGVLLVPSSRMDEPDKLIRLWIHEVYRVFNDRLTEDSDR